MDREIEKEERDKVREKELVTKGGKVYIENKEGLSKIKKNRYKQQIIFKI